MIILYFVKHQIRFVSNQVTIYKLQFVIRITDYDKSDSAAIQWQTMWCKFDR